MTAAPLLLLLAAAQARPDTIAFAGAAGVYVWTGTAASRAHPVDGIVAFRVERRRPGSGDWQRMTEVHAVESARDLFAPLDSVTRAAVRRALRARTDDAAWDSIVRHPGADALAPIIGDERIRLGLGIYALDRNVRTGETWEYRVTALDAGGRSGRQVVGVPVAFPAKTLPTPVTTISVQGRANGADLVWYITPGHPQAKSLEVWRRRGQTGPFGLVDSILTLLRAGDSLQALYADRALRSGETYQYYVVPRDAFANRGPASDTVTVYAVAFETTPLPDSLAVTSDDALGLVVSWRFGGSARARTIRVFRGPGQDGPWRQVAEVPAASGKWADPQAEAMQVYYYRLQVTGLRGEESPPTASVFGVYRSTRVPAPPNGVRIDAGSGRRGVRVLWIASADPDVAGYVVSRSNHLPDSITADTPVSTASPLLGSRDSTFVDTSSAVAAGREYAFLVQAVSRSGVRSAYSEPAYYAPPAVDSLPAPNGVEATVYGSRIRLSWEDMTTIEFSVAGYVVLRRAGPGPTDTLTRTPLDKFENRFLDSTATPGRAYEYTVVSVSADGRRSAASFPARAEVPVARPPAPTGLRVFSSDSGLVVAFDQVYGWGAATVRVYRSAGSAPAERVAEVPVTALRYLDRAARPGVRYFYALTLVAGVAESERSLEVSGRR